MNAAAAGVTDPESTMQLFYINHLLCAIVDNHFGSRLSGTDDSDRMTVTVGELLHALRNAFELGQSVRSGK